MELVADFYNDWLAELKDILLNHWGYEPVDISNITDDELPLFYFNAENRRPSPKPRKVFESDTFSCTSDLKKGWDNLKKSIENGTDISPYLSTSVDKASFTDGLLDHWGIYHFHLGTKFKGKFVTRTGPLLYAFIDEENFFALNIGKHGDWEKIELVETLHRNWPELMHKYRVNGVLSYSPTEADIKELRKKNYNSFCTVSDGTSYFPMGGGVTSNNLNVRHRMRTDRQRAFLRDLQEQLSEQMDAFLPAFRKRGLEVPEKLHAELTVTENAYKAYIKELDGYVTLYRLEGVH